MSIVREYFDNDFKRLGATDVDLRLQKNGQPAGRVATKVVTDFLAHAKFWCFYVPSGLDAHGVLTLLLDTPGFAACDQSDFGVGMNVEITLAHLPGTQSSETLTVTRAIHFYVDQTLSDESKTALVDQANAAGYVLYVKDQVFADGCSAMERPLAFVSHDSRDKDSFVRPLVQELGRHRCKVWYDEYSLKVGDSLRASIERGLREAPKVILVLSPNFLSNDGWGRAEYDSAFTREMIEKENVLLPVWLDVGVRDVYQYSPRLADKFGLAGSLGAAEVARRLANALQSH